MLIFREGKSFYISKRLAENLDRYIKGVLNKKTSAVFIIDGRSGLGKTTLSSQIGCYINNEVKKHYEKKKLKSPPKFTLDSMVWTPRDFIDILRDPNKKLKKGDIIIMDEAMIISSRATMSEVNRAVIIMMSMIRSKELFIIFNVNSIFDLDKNLPLHRAEMLIHLYPKEGKFAARGAYSVIPSSGGRLTYLYITGKKYYNYSKAKQAFSDNFSKFFPFSEEEYESRKQEAISKFGAIKDPGKKNRDIRNRYIKYIVENLPGLTRDEVARIGGISIRTVFDAVSEKEINTF